MKKAFSKNLALKAIYVKIVDGLEFLCKQILILFFNSFFLKLFILKTFYAKYFYTNSI